MYLKPTYAPLPTATDSNGNPRSKYTREQVSEHTTAEDCWVICHNFVYDVSTYLNEHPGGIPLIMKSAGKDCTSDFEAMFHSPKARNILQKYLVGELDQTNSVTSGRRNHLTNFASNNKVKVSAGIPGTMSPPSQPPNNQKPVVEVNPYGKRASTFKEPRVASPKKEGTAVSLSVTPALVLSSTEFLEYKVMLVQNLTHDTKIFTLKLPQLTEFLPLKIGQHIQVAFSDESCENGLLVRKFTPTNIEHRGFFELTVKLYQNGKMSQKLSKIKIGDVIRARGPFGLDDLNERVQNCETLIMICVGSGITPMYQVVKHLASIMDSNKSTNLKRVNLLYGNKTIQDIIFENDLNSLSKELNNDKLKFEMIHRISRESQDKITTDYTTQFNFVKYESGRIDTNYVKQHLSNISNGLFLLCGTDDFVSATKQTLFDLGYDNNQIHWF